MEKEIILDTIKKMVDSGIDDQTILSTLQDVGLDESEIKSLLMQAKGRAQAIASNKPSSTSSPIKEGLEDLEELPDVDETAPLTQALKSSSEEVGLAATQLANASQNQQQMFEQQSQHVQEMKAQVSEMHQKVSNIPQTMDERILDVEEKLDELQNSLSDQKALMMAFQDILKKVLDTNRSILIQLQKKM